MQAEVKTEEMMYTYSHAMERDESRNPHNYLNTVGPGKEQESFSWTTVDGTVLYRTQPNNPKLHKHQINHGHPLQDLISRQCQPVL
jgi:hypothetical protein